MYFNILKRDLKRKKTMNIIVLLFVILSVLFISSSANNLVAVSSSLDTFFDKSEVSDFVVFERAGGKQNVADALKVSDDVKSIKQEECIFLSDFEFDSHKKANVNQSTSTSLISCLSHKIEKYFDPPVNARQQFGEGRR